MESGICGGGGSYKTDMGKNGTRRRSGGGRVKNFTLGQNCVSWRKRPKSRDNLLKKKNGIPQDTYNIVCNTLTCYKDTSVARRLNPGLF